LADFDIFPNWFQKISFGISFNETSGGIGCFKLQPETDVALFHINVSSVFNLFLSIRQQKKLLYF